MEKDYRVSGFINRHLKKALFLSVGFCLIISILVPIFNNGSELRITAAAGLSVFVIFHGIHRYGWQKMIVFLVITFLVSWIFETTSIATGFPFGRFYYTDLLGIKAGNVPLGIMMEYFFMGYLTWTIGGIFLNETTAGINRKNLLFLPILAALIMVLWNLSFDPVMSTVEGNWIWVNGGLFQGVPLSNFAGWFLTTYISFQLFAIFIYKLKNNEKIIEKKWYWILVPILFSIQSVEFLIHPFIRTENLEIYICAFWIAVLSVALVSFLSIIAIYRKTKLL